MGSRVKGLLKKNRLKKVLVKVLNNAIVRNGMWTGVGGGTRKVGERESEKKLLDDDEKKKNLVKKPGGEAFILVWGRQGKTKTEFVLKRDVGGSRYRGPRGEETVEVGNKTQFLQQTELSLTEKSNTLKKMAVLNRTKKKGKRSCGE